MNRSPIQTSAISPRPARVLIVDDHPMMLEGLSALLSSQSDMVKCGEATNINDALAQVHKASPDVAVVDISLNGESGLELIRQIKSANPSLPILVLSMYDDGLYAERALEAGAMGYLNKQAVGKYIVVAIRRVLGGSTYLSEKIEGQLASRAIQES